MNATPGAYKWWYFDALSDDGTQALSAILFVGSVFSPSYALRLRRGESALPEEHVAVNLALYREGRLRTWVMSEYGREALHGIGPAGPSIATSQIESRENGVKLSVRDRSAPFLLSLTGAGARVQGSVELDALSRPMPEMPLDAGGQHLWRVVVPRGRVRVRFTHPRFDFDGVGYHDVNWGDARLEAAFSRWSWARFHEGDRTVVMYSARERSGAQRALVVDTRDGEEARPVKPGPEGAPRPVGWGLSLPSWFSVEHPAGGRVLRCDPDEMLQVAPFYARYVARLSDGGHAAGRGMGEYLDLDRFAKRGIQFLLRFKTRRV